MAIPAKGEIDECETGMCTSEQGVAVEGVKQAEEVEEETHERRVRERVLRERIAEDLSSYIGQREIGVHRRGKGRRDPRPTRIRSEQS